jgi:hypothetical protein
MTLWGRVPISKGILASGASASLSSSELKGVAPGSSPVSVLLSSRQNLDFLQLLCSRFESLVSLARSIVSSCLKLLVDVHVAGS